MKESTLWYILGGLLVLMMGTAVCAPQMPGCAPPSGGGPVDGPEMGGPKIGGGMPPRGGPESGPDMGPGLGRGPGIDRIDAPEVRQKRGGRISDYDMLPVPGEAIPMGCAPVSVVPKVGIQDPGIPAAYLKQKYGNIIRGNPSQEQMEIVQKGISLVESAASGITRGRQVFVYQNLDEYERDIVEKEGITRRDLKCSGKLPNGLTTGDLRRMYLGPKMFEGGNDRALYILVHEFGHIANPMPGGPPCQFNHPATQRAEVAADKWATKLLGYSFPSRPSKEAGMPEILPGAQKETRFAGVIDNEYKVMEI